jgi:hypothetical protein
VSLGGNRIDTLTSSLTQVTSITASAVEPLTALRQ